MKALDVLARHANGQKIPGLQVLAWANLGELWTVTIKVKGLTFSWPGGTPDQALDGALKAAGYSDQLPYSDVPAPVIKSGGGGGNWGAKKGTPPADPNARASQGAIGSFFALGKKDLGWPRHELEDLFSEAMGVAYKRDIEETITVGQLAAARAKLEKSERATAPVRKANGKELAKLRDVAKAAGLEGRKLDGWLAQGGLKIFELQAAQFNECLTKLFAIIEAKNGKSKPAHNMDASEIGAMGGAALLAAGF